MQLKRDSISGKTPPSSFLARGISINGFNAEEVSIFHNQITALLGSSDSGLEYFLKSVLVDGSRERLLFAHTQFRRWATTQASLPPVRELSGVLPVVSLLEQMEALSGYSSIFHYLNLSSLIEELHEEVAEYVCKNCKKPFRKGLLERVAIKEGEVAFFGPWYSKKNLTDSLSLKNLDSELGLLFSAWSERGSRRVLIGGEELEAFSKEDSAQAIKKTKAFFKEKSRKGGLSFIVDSLSPEGELYPRLREVMRQFLGEAGVFQIGVAKKGKLISSTLFGRYLICETCGETLSKEEAKHLLQMELEEVLANQSSKGREKRSKEEKGFTKLFTFPIKEFLNKSPDALIQSLENERFYHLKEAFLVLSRFGFLEVSIGRNPNTLSLTERLFLVCARISHSKNTSTLYLLEYALSLLHKSDRPRLLAFLDELVETGNTVALLESDKERVESFSNILRFDSKEESGLTEQIALGKREKSKQILYRNSSISIPKGSIVSLVGPSASGKTKFLDTLEAHFGPKKSRRISLFETKRKKERVDVLADAIGIWPRIANIYASQEVSRLRGFTELDFQFVTSKHLCSQCHGKGEVVVEYERFGSSKEICDRCVGKRFRETIFEPTIKGLNVSEMLSLSIKQAQAVFAERREISDALSLLLSVGLQSLILGESVQALSETNFSRFELARVISKKGKEVEVLLLDRILDTSEKALSAQIFRLFKRLSLEGIGVICETNREDLIEMSDFSISFKSGESPYLCG